MPHSAAHAVSCFGIAEVAAAFRRRQRRTRFFHPVQTEISRKYPPVPVAGLQIHFCFDTGLAPGMSVKDTDGQIRLW